MTPTGTETARNRAPERIALAALLLGLALAGCRDDGVPDSWLERALEAPVQVSLEDQIRVPPPPFREEDVFPCSDCHDPEIPVSREPRVLEMAHTEVVLRHAEGARWCLDCHNAEDRDFLHLANGELVPFEESHRLCGQCHGDKHRDWRAGLHGRRTGQWDGEKEYLLCVHCHDSHDPKFKPLPPEPAPRRPERTP